MDFTRVKKLEALLNVRRTWRAAAAQVTGQLFDGTVFRQAGHVSGLSQEHGHHRDSFFKAAWVLAFLVLTSQPFSLQPSQVSYMPSLHVPCPTTLS